MSYTLAEAQEMLDAYKAAELAVLKGQSYTIKDRTLTRANHASIVRERKYWQRVVASLTGGSFRVRRTVIRDS